MESKILLHVNKSPPLGSVLSLMNPIHTFTSYFFNIHLNVIVSYMFMSFKWSLSVIKISHAYVNIPILCYMCHRFKNYEAYHVIFLPS
jgi:hypothetical protein